MDERLHDLEAGTWIEEPQPGGGPARRGLVVEVLGRPGHRHYRVRWDEEHESIHFPSPRARVLTRTEG